MHDLEHFIRMNKDPKYRRNYLIAVVVWRVIFALLKYGSIALILWGVYFFILRRG